MTRLTVIGIFIAGLALGWQLRAWLTTPPVSPGMPSPVPHAVVESPPSSTQPVQSSIPKEPSLHAQLDQLLGAGAFEQAVALVYEQSDDAALKQRLLDVAKRLSSEHAGAAMRLLRAFVDVYRFEAPAHVQLADLYAAQGDMQKQLDELFTAQSLQVDVRKKEHLQGQINLVVSAWANKLDTGNAYVEKIRLYEYLLQQQPEITRYYLDLAQAQTDAGQHDAARRTLEAVRNDPTVGGEAERLLAQLDAFEENFKGPAVTLAKQDSHFLVDAWVNDRQPVRLLIDTGASVTSMSADMRRHLGLSDDDVLERQWTNTANGRVMAELYRIDSLAIDDYRVAPIHIAIIDQLNLPNADGLLGMNFLSHFEFNIDQQSGKLFLRAR